LPVNKSILPVLFHKVSLILLYLLISYEANGKFTATPEELKRITGIYRHHIDSFRFLIASSSSFTVKVDCLNAMSTPLGYFSADSGLAISIEARALSRKNNYYQGEVAALLQMGNFHQDKKDYRGALALYDTAIGICLARGMDSMVLEVYPAIMNLYFYFGDYRNAIRITTNGLKLAERIRDDKKIANYNNLMAYINLKQGDFAKAERYYGIYLHLASQLRDSGLQAHALASIADLYLEEGNYNKALAHFSDALSIYSAIAHGEIYKVNTIERQVYVLNEISKTYKQMGAIGQALKYSEKSIALMEKAPCNKYDIADYLINAGDIYSILKMPGKSIRFLKEGLQLAKEIQHQEDMHQAYRSLAQAYAQQKKYDSAYKYHVLYTTLEDSLVNDRSRRDIARIVGDFDLERKDRQILLLNQQKDIQQAAIIQQNQLRNIVIGISLFIITILSLLYNRYRIRQKIRYQEQVNRQQHELINAVITTQDKERKRIAQDIHDRLGSTLSSAKLRISDIEDDDKMTDHQRERLNSTMLLLDEAVIELRELAQNIMPATLSKLGLVSAIRNRLENLSAISGLDIVFNADGFESRLPEEMEINLYQVLLELVNNVIKHAHAKHLTVQLIKHSKYINITVEDDGTGFDKKLQAQHRTGLGLSNIASRIEYLGGVVIIDSQPGGGTTVLIDIEM
jgi:two-component system NarL family sensor kinase